MPKLTDDPWRDLPTPVSEMEVTVRRVDSKGRFDFFWARDTSGSPLLILRHSGAMTSTPVPKLHGLELREAPGNSGERPMMIWKLNRREHQELFRELCGDVISATEGCKTERAALETAIGRTWRWHHLLRGGRNERLSIQRQMGLVAELLVLETFALPHLPQLSAVRSWKGPLGESHDFVSRGTAMEAKARAEGNEATVQISSEFQLDRGQHQALWLLVATLEEMGQEADDTVTLDGLVARLLRDMVEQPAATQLFQSLLAAAGFDRAHTYSDKVWRVARLDAYRVEEDFPRLVHDCVPAGVRDVTYRLALGECARFLHDRSVLDAWIREAPDE